MNEVQATILQDPYRGDRNRGTLSDAWVEKFPAQNDQYLGAYEVDDKNRIVTFLDIGHYENSYRDLEKYRKTAL